MRIKLYRFPIQLVFNFTGDIVLIFLMIPNIEILISAGVQEILCACQKKDVLNTK